MGSSCWLSRTMFSNMDLAKVDSGTETLDQASGALWRKTVLTSCVLAGCLALIAALAIF